MKASLHNAPVVADVFSDLPVYIEQAVPAQQFATLEGLHAKMCSLRRTELYVEETTIQLHDSRQWSVVLLKNLDWMQLPKLIVIDRETVGTQYR